VCASLLDTVGLTEPGHAAEIERLYTISVEIAGLQELSRVMDRTLDYCLELTGSQFGFVGLMLQGNQIDVAAIKGFQPSDPGFHERFRSIPVRPSVFGTVVITGRSYLSNDVPHDPLHLSAPRGHPGVHTFLGVPLLFGGEVLGMLGVANREGGYTLEQERLLSIFANQVAVAIRNARLYEQQRDMIGRLQQLRSLVEQAERDRLLEDERRRIAQELHDRVAQTFFSIGLTANAALETPLSESDSNGDSDSRLRGALGAVRSLSSEGAEQMREAIFALIHAEVHDRGLVQALWKLVRSFQSRTGLEADLVLVGTERRLPPRLAETLHAAAREALANVEHHAQASAVVVSLHFSPRAATLTIQDDGVGVSPLMLRGIDTSATHFGLRDLRERVRRLGGTFSIRSGDDGGLVLRTRLPLLK
jgi:signal transduction histidine kinase